MTILAMLWPRHHAYFKDFFSRQKIDVYSMAGFDSEDLKKAVEFGGGKFELLGVSSELAKSIWAEKDNKLEEAVRELVGFYPNAADLVRAYPWENLSQNYQEALLVVRLLEELKRKVGTFKILLSEEYTNVMKSVVAWARGYDMVTVHIIHGFGLDRLYTVHRIAACNYYLVPGRRSSDALIDMGVPESRIKFRGSAELDFYNAVTPRRSAIRAHYLSTHNLSVSLKTVLFATTFEANLTYYRKPEIQQQTVECFLDACEYLHSKGLQFNIIIKDRATSKEDAARLEWTVNHYKATMKNIVIVYGGAQHWMLSTDVLVAVNSSLLIEGLMVDIPSLNLTGFDSEYRLPVFGPTDFECVNGSNLAAALLLSLNSKQFISELSTRRQSILNQYCDPTAQPADVAVTEIMKEICGSG